MRTPLLTAALGVTVLLGSVALAGCSNDSGIAADSVSSMQAKGLGDILVDGKGDVLYVFKPDNAMTVSCTGTCASKWPPLRTEDKETPKALKKVAADRLGSLPDPSGGNVVTYNGWPLYRYVADQQPGQHRGQNIYLNGGDWYVIGTDGKPVSPSPTEQ